MVNDNMIVHTKERGFKGGAIDSSGALTPLSTSAQAVRERARQRKNACDFQAMDDFRRDSPIVAALQAIGVADEDYS